MQSDQLISEMLERRFFLLLQSLKEVFKISSETMIPMIRFTTQTHRKVSLRKLKNSRPKSQAAGSAAENVHPLQDYKGLTLVAHGPFWPLPTSNSTFWPSLSDL